MRVIDAIRVFIVLLLAGIIFTVPIAIGWLVPMHYRRVIFCLPWFIWARCVCIVCRIDLRVKGREYIQKDSHRGRIFICNHQSALDIPLLVAVYPLPFLTKKENLYIPFIGLAGLLAGSIAFNRDSSGERRRILDKIVDRAKRHTSLYVFPEGTRSKTGDLQKKVFPALLRMAWRAGLEVVPIAMHGSYVVIGYKPNYNGYYPVAMEIGAPIKASDFTNDKEFAEHCWQQVIKQHTNVAAEVNALQTIDPSIVSVL